VELYEGDRLVAQDVHYGETGIVNKNNVYHLNVQAFRQSLDDYVLRVTGAGKGGSDSRGTIVIKKRN
jgi:alpha-N-acetylglucosaminidase